MANTEITTYNDLVENPVPRCACMLVLDTSGSMDGAPIAELNEGVRRFIEATMADEVARYSVEVGVVTFGGRVSEVSALTPVHLIEGVATLQSSGDTPMGQAVKLALEKLDARKREYQQTGTSYYQPWLVIMSDGAPTDSWQDIAQETALRDAQKKLVVLPVGVGTEADLSVLSQFAARGAKQLSGLKFEAFFEWLSASMSRVSGSTPGAKVNLPGTGSWDSI